jgi:2-amino-4-hydroxy-6-hydroxymethyldihydropteridine diphosphokinase
LKGETALISMGSNIEPERHLLFAARKIRQRFPDAVFSRVYRSEPLGMKGGDFLNACCRLETGLRPEEIKAWLLGIESDCKRDRSRGSWEPRTLDLDLLMLGDRVLDRDLYRYAHLYMPASDLVRLRPADSFEGTIRPVDLRL